MKSDLRVLFLAAEADPYVKIGGLGDFAGSLPPALLALGDLDVRLAIPFHGAIHRRHLELKRVAAFELPHPTGPQHAEILETSYQGLPVYLVGGTPINPDGPVYTPDNLADGFKFTFFSLAVLEFLHRIDWAPHIIHANDWHTSPAIYALSLGNDAFYRETATILGLHNLPYMGNGAGPALASFGLSPALGSALPWWAQDFPLPLGLLAADQIVAASPNYALEVLTPEFGSGLDDFLHTRADTVSGILNGIDVTSWDPTADQALAMRYSVDTLDERTHNKSVLVEEFGLDSNPRLPLIAMVTRMDPQKGIDLLPEALNRVSDLGWQIILLGTGMPAMEDIARAVERQYQRRVRAAIRFDALLSRRIYAGADLLLLPSRYEPCGLAQMIAMRYGCVPVARATGGLRDTIIDHSPAQVGTGFLFPAASSISLANAIRRAINVFNTPETWRHIQQNGMRQDFSWERFARQYKDLYHQVYTRKIEQSQTTADKDHG
jgi:starch synthase